ncbi:hypothetical protein AB0K60_23875 [Thermopolyspora sp. NPDC052614]|uniref:hypothetical protein n=1 Tax=Thermopolyspora sp. NPDC052614 TaxID=3155682 RepID=UPI00343AF34A
MAISASPDYTCLRAGAPGTGDNPDTPGSWDVVFRDGRTFRWEGFYTGPRVLSPDRLREICRQLLGIDLDDVPAAAASGLRPYVSDGTPTPSIILHSATPVLKSVEADLSDAMNGRVADDVATYVEARAVSLAGPGDVVVGRTHPWAVAARLAGVEAVAIPGIDFYYLSHAILDLAANGGEDPAPLRRLVRVLTDRPHTLIRLYALDREIQMVLLYLKRQAGLDFLLTDANSPEVADYWNTKAPLHPLATEAARLTVGDDPEKTLRDEICISPIARKLHIECPVLPGYTVGDPDRAGADIGDEIRLAARLLADRYGLTRGCFKPSEGGAGARIVRDVRLGDDAALDRLAEAARRTGGQYILEPQFSYLTATVSGTTFTLAPSGHVRYGHVADGLTLQFTNGTSWQGNLYFDAAACHEVGVGPAEYAAITTMLRELYAAFTENGHSLVTAGFDFAVGTVGGAFGGRLFTVMQDPNLSSHGAEYLRLFLDTVRDGRRTAYAATKVVIPRAPLGVLRERQVAEDPRRFRVLTAIPGRWGMIAASGPSPRAAMEELGSREKELLNAGLVVEAPPR